MIDEKYYRDMENVNPKERITRKKLSLMRKSAESKEYNKRLAFAASCGVLDLTSNTPVALHVEMYSTHLNYIKDFNKWEELCK